ncbi:hypothetical protein ASPZODRAFT_135445 [Penicilliopsis zonata CBS 506.65]|uniref:Uncharacterized protein n=1 Tax=Penicilliopsis zonata CBS 506.65 TaxID=1073090 RepID=A0A1L9SA07_9EURO|nr:hypothetical protein ASPZODRAFT_135445 [Penicilliopsis zonata CBS 506.65]OJJ44012.1 hypothetical protein ASPZODRAFT_135445 [Penicilliopsis zonata CBS 506.65]
MASETSDRHHLLRPVSEPDTGSLDLGHDSLRYHSVSSFQEIFDDAFHPTADIGLGIKDPSITADALPRNHQQRRPSSEEEENLPLNQSVHCPTKHNILLPRFSWIQIVIVALAAYATVFSGIYLVIACLKPHYGKLIGNDGGLSPSTATLLSALFAKTIEMSYVTVAVAFLGQVLSRRAITQGSRGISISDMSMRAWIMQPGSILVHWETLRYSALTILGMITLTAALVSMLYTTAAEALVSPKLVMGPVHSRLLKGQVWTKFANPYYLSAHCETPITTEMDPEYSGSTCLEIEHVGQAFHNYQEYIQSWSELVKLGNATSVSLETRLPPHGAVFDNTTVTGSYIEIKNMTEVSRKYGRMVNNVTAAMPHGGLFAAAADPINEIRQPEDLAGEGKYVLDASIPSPAVNVLCVGMTAAELSPLIYTEWPYHQTFNGSTWYSDPPADIPVYPNWLNRTVVDDLFEFGPKYGQRPPIFPIYPQPYNTILNITGMYEADAIYLLGAAPKGHTPDYVLCSMKAKQSGRCSTHYVVAASGATVSLRCEDPSDPLQYDLRVANVVEDYYDPDWKNVAADWANAVALGTGVTDGDGSNERLLMQMIPSFDNQTNTSSLSPKLPSISEALAVMAGSTLMLSTQDAPFVPYWSYNTTSLDKPVYQEFNATLQAVVYASGNTQQWQGIFYLVLVFAFLTSVICLVFMLLEVRGRQITDFTEPQNLFALAMNSPATARLQGACGGGPYGRQLNERWFVGMEENTEHYYIRSKIEGNLSTPYLRMRQQTLTEQFDMDNPSKSASPAVDEFRRVSATSTVFSRFY